MNPLKRAERQGQKFLNPVPTTVGSPGMVFKVLPLYLKNKQEAEPKVQLGPFRTNASIYGSAPKSGLRITWFGHSCSLVEIDGYRVLIDPVWYERASPFSFMGPKRFFAPTLEAEELPTVDIVLISHDHYDHLGAKTVQRLCGVPAVAGATWVTSVGVGKRLHAFGVPAEQVKELDWTESVEIGRLRVTAWPARHFSGRGIFDRFKTLWSSFVFEGLQHRVFYGADSGYWEGFEEIAAQYGGFDVTMLEIGAFHPLWESIHLGPDGAARAFHQMGYCADGERARGGLLMPIHWGLFNLALHAWRQPIQRMREVAVERGLPLWQPEPGRPTEVVRGVPLGSDWWV